MIPQPDKTTINERNKYFGLNNNQHKTKNTLISKINGKVSPNIDGNHNLSGGI